MPAYTAEFWLTPQMLCGVWSNLAKLPTLVQTLHPHCDSIVLEECTNVHVNCSESNIMFQIVQLVVIKVLQIQINCTFN